MRKLISTLAFLILCSIPSLAQNVKVEGIAAKGGKLVRTSANVQHTLMETFPSCTVTVYVAGSLTIASIFTDETGTPKANPFTAASDASYSFYVAEGRYDIKFSGTGILSPFTLSDVFVVANGGGGGGGTVTSVFGRTGDVIYQTGDVPFTGLNFTSSDFASITNRSASDLNAGTLPDARFPAILPAVSGINLTNLNATNITNGTLNDARLSTNVPLKNAVNIFSANNIFSTNVGINTTTPRRRLDILDPSNAQLRLSAVDNSVYVDLFADSGGSLIVSPTGNTIFNSTGKQINPLNTFDQNLGQINKKYLSLHAAELFVETLVAQNTIATIGGRIIVAPSNILLTDLAAGTLSISVKYNNLAAGDIIYFEGNSSVEFMSVTSGATPITGGFSYSVTRNLDGTGANQWFAGDALVNTGVSGNGFIDLYSIRGVKSSSQLGPTIVGNVRNSVTFNDWTERWAVGNLNGIYGYGTDTYGAAFGVPTGAWIKIDPSNGVRIGFNNTTKTQIDAAGNASFTGAVTAATGNIANWAISADRLSNDIVSIGAGFCPSGTSFVWFGKCSGSYSGVRMQDANGIINMLVGNSTIFPYLQMTNSVGDTKVVIGGLNNAWAGTTDGASSSMGMKVWGNSGERLVEFSSIRNVIGGWSINSGKISSTGIDLTSGANAYLSFGVSPPLTPTSGTGLFIDRTGLYGIASDIIQVEINATNGAMQAGAGNVIIDSDGISLLSGTNSTNKIKWKSGSDTIYTISGSHSSTTVSGSLAAIQRAGVTTGFSNITMSAINNIAASANIQLYKYDNSHATNANWSVAQFGGFGGQIGGVIITGTTSPVIPAASTVLELSSTTGAFLPTRMTSTQRDALTPTNGMIIYNSTTDKLQVRAAGAWVDLH